MTDAATPETATAAESLDLDGAARAIERVLTERTPDDATRRKRMPVNAAAGGARADVPAGAPAEEGGHAALSPEADADADADAPELQDGAEGGEAADSQPRYTVKVDGGGRTAERRVGKEGGRTSRTR